MNTLAVRFIRAVALAMLVAHGQGASAGDVTSPGPAASEPKFKVSAEEISKRLNPYRNAVGSVVQTEPTPLGELVWVDSGGDRRPDTLTLNGEVIVPPRKAEDGSLYGLHYISGEGYDDQKTGERGYRKLLISQTNLACQHILLDFTGPEVWVSPRFPEERQFPGADMGCIPVTWVTWTSPYPFFYLGGPGEGHWIFGYNAKLKAVIGPVDDADAPPHPECKSFVPQPFGAIAECEAAVKEREKKAKSKVRPKSPS